MSDEPQDAKSEKQPDYEPPRGAQTTATWSAGDTTIDYTATAGWLVLRKKESNTNRTRCHQRQPYC